MKVYITTVSLSNLYCYMFRHFRVIIGVFTTNALLSYTLSSSCSPFVDVIHVLVWCVGCNLKKVCNLARHWL